MSTRPGSARGEQLLVLCRANVARSPLTARLLRLELDRLGRTDLVVKSAGLEATAGSPSVDEAVQAGLAHGVDLTDHRSVRVTAEMLSRAALVLTMTEPQRAAAERLARAAVPYTFTLTELIRLYPPWEDERAETLSDLARRAHRRRPFVAPAQTPEDIADPVGRPLRHYQAMTGRLAELSAQVAGHLTPTTPR